MCKHILFNDFRPSDSQALKLFASKTSDRDGFGAIIRTRKNQIEVLKSLDLASFYFDLCARISRGDIRTLVVHHRTSTNSPGLDYAHPFEFQGNYLTHNGVVRVPGEHATKTTNDSEALLHHFIKTGYETETVEGYFSTFTLNANETIVTVDDCAPMYTDGRVYSSHKLGDEFKSVSLERLTLDPFTGLVVDRKNIKVVKTSYGMDKSALSLGYASNYSTLFTDDGPIVNITPNVEDFFDSLNYSEEDELYRMEDKTQLRAKILEISSMLQIDLSETEIDSVMSFLV